MSKKLLLVESSATIQKAVSLCLSQTEFEIIPVKVLSDTVSKTQSVHPDVIAIDVVGDNGAGYEICEQLKTTPGLDAIPVLLMAGTAVPLDAAKASACGADDNIQKPFDSQIFLEKVFALAGLAAPTPLPGVLVRRPKNSVAPASSPAPAKPAIAAPVPPPPAPTSTSKRMPIGSPVPPPAPMSGMSRPPMAPVGKASRPPMAPVTGAPSAPRPPMTPGVRPPMPPASRPPMIPPHVQEQFIRAAMQRVSRDVLEKVVWEVVPRLAETLIREQLEKMDLAALQKKSR